MKRLIAVIGLLGILANLSGCIVWDIRNEMRKTNANLVDVQERLTKLDTTNSSLERTNTGLEKTNVLIDNVERGLGRIDSTNSSLNTLEQQLALLQSIDKSLTHLDAHLASLRKTISKLDGVIPFLDLGGDAPVGPEPSPAGAEPTVAAAEAAPAPDGKPAEGAAAVAAKREPLGGTWLTQYPSRDSALVILQDGRYFWATRVAGTPGASASGGGTITVEKGTWKRADATMSFQAEPVVVPADAKKPDSKPSTKPGRSWSLSVVALTAKAATVEIDGNLTVMSRP